MSQVGQMSQNSEERRQALNDSQRLRQKAQRQPGVADALRAFYLSPFRADLLPASIDPHRLERQRRARLFSLIVTILTLIQLGSACAQIATAAPTEVVMGQIAIVALSLVCLSLNRAGWTTVASVLYLGGSIAGVTFASTETGAALDLRGLMILSILLIFIVLSGLLLPRWAIWVIAAVCAGVVLYTLRTRRLVETAAGEEATRATLIGIFLIILLALATLTWIASRSTFAGLSTLAAAVEREHELAALKDLFIMDVNHELRTPIMTLYNNLELLDLMRRRNADGERQALALRRARSAGDAVLHLLNTILDPTVLNGQVPRLTLEPVSLTPLVRNILETFDPREVGESVTARPGDEPRPVRLELEDDLILLADAIRLRQVLVNLLANAVKYSSPGTPIEVTASAVWDTTTESANASTACVRVRDHGLGVPPTEQRKLFQRFVRLERDITGPVRGTGIGLYTCRTLVEAMGGAIWVESEGVPGYGSTFAFTLPLWSSAEPSAEPSAESGASA
jgi:signal transduction histidine kinase